MTFPVADLVRPAVLAGQPNGRLDPGILVEVPGQDGGPTVRLVEPAARAWQALCAAALAEGHVLKATGPADSYRPFDVQDRIFRDRYTTDVLSGRPFKTWQGQRWYQRPGTAVAATPGSSNHGLGLAVDTGEEWDTDPMADSLDVDTLGWLVANEFRFGFSHELQSEQWHIRYFPGDNIPAEVLAFEESNMPLNPNDIDQIRIAVRAVLDEGTAFGTIGWAGTSKATVDGIRDITMKVDQLLNRVAALEAKVD